MNIWAAMHGKIEGLVPKEVNREGRIDEFIASLRLKPFFHPITDVFTGDVLGYEVLARGDGSLQSPLAMFREAERIGACRELEMACVHGALGTISTFPDPLSKATFFLNISPTTFENPRFLDELSKVMLQKYGVDRKRIVIEITEERAIQNYAAFEQMIAHCSREGFRIALDDFGSGHSGLMTLVASTPHFLKLDMAIVRDAHKHDYKQKLIKSIASFASSVNSRLIAEGVETVEELEVMMRYGIRYVQGYIFGLPEPHPYVLSRQWRQTLKGFVEKYDVAAVDLDTRISSLVTFPVVAEKNSIQCRDLDLMFKRDSKMDHLVVLDQDRIEGLVTRQHFYAETGGPFGYELLQKKPVEKVCDYEPLVVEEKTTVTMLAKLAMDRPSERLYDPVLVTGSGGRFLGSITVKQVLEKSIELEIRSALGLSPLTGLPGNNVIHRWILQALSWPEYTIIYADLDNFKGYNDVYGFVMGDEFLRYTGETLSRWLKEMPPGSRLGHIGGDDFVLVSPGLVEEEVLASLCRCFDSEKTAHFRTADLERGCLITRDRQGRQVRTPLATLSLAAIDSSKVRNEESNPALFSEIAASLKKKVKQQADRSGRSWYLFERRLHEGDSGLPEARGSSRSVV